MTTMPVAKADANGMHISAILTQSVSTACGIIPKSGKAGSPSPCPVHNVNSAKSPIEKPAPKVHETAQIIRFGSHASILIVVRIRDPFCMPESSYSFAIDD